MHEAFLLLTLLTNYLPPVETFYGLDVVEFFSGVARISRLAKRCGYEVLAVDTLYDSTAPPPKAKKKDRALYLNSRSAMDLNTSGGFMLLVPSFPYSNWCGLEVAGVKLL